jgi:hypothetical protein
MTRFVSSPNVRYPENARVTAGEGKLVRDRIRVMKDAEEDERSELA